MKFNKIILALFLVLTCGCSLRAAEPKDDVLYFLISFNAYSSDNYNIKYSPTELSIKKAIEALSKISDNDFVTLENIKYPKEKIHAFVALTLQKKLKNLDKLSSLLKDYKFFDKEIAKKEDAESLIRMAKTFKEYKNSGAKIYDVVPTEFDIIKGIAAAIKYKNKADREAYLNKVVEPLIRDKQQLLKDLEAMFKKLLVPAPSPMSSPVSSSKIAVSAPAVGVAQDKAKK